MWDLLIPCYALIAVELYRRIRGQRDILEDLLKLPPCIIFPHVSPFDRND
jgi:hypothetical protein